MYNHFNIITGETKMDEMHGNLIPHDNVTSQEYSHEAEKNMFTTFTLQTG